MTAARSARKTSRPAPKGSRAQLELRLYVAGMTSRARKALANLQKICDEHLDGRYSIEVVDLLDNPRLAADDQIFAVPTLVRKLPLPVQKIIGDLSDKTKVLVGLNMKPRT